MQSFKGRVVHAGNFEGEALVTHQGFNTLASFEGAITDKSPLCTDQNNPDLYQKKLPGTILCLPTTIGSTSGGMVILCAAALGLSPTAMLYADHIDTVSAPGIVLTSVWTDTEVICIDQLGKKFLDTVQTGHKIVIKDTGEVDVYS
jgi:uncharacterized protein